MCVYVCACLCVYLFWMNFYSRFFSIYTYYTQQLQSFNVNRSLKVNNETNKHNPFHILLWKLGDERRQTNLIDRRCVDTYLFAEIPMQQNDYFFLFVCRKWDYGNPCRKRYSDSVFYYITISFFLNGLTTSKRLRFYLNVAYLSSLCL